MKNIFILIILIIIWSLIVTTFQIGEPTIYKEIDHSESEILQSIERLKESSKLERIIWLSDSIIAKSIKSVSYKINKINYDYYYMIDYCIDYYKKDPMLTSMTLKEWYEFKQNKVSWELLAWSCTPLWTKSWPYVNQSYRLEKLKRIETDILKK